MSCETATALRALDKGHVRWDQLHPAVRERLEASGYHAGSFVDCTGRASHLRPLQHNERWPGRQR